LFESSPTSKNIAANDPEWQKMIRDKSTQKWIMDMYYKEKGFEEMVDQLGLDPDLKKIAKDMNRVEALYGMVDKKNIVDGKKLASSLSHEETIELVNTKARLAQIYGDEYAVTDTEKSALFHELWQGVKNGPIMSEIEDLLTRDKSVAKSLDGVKFDGEKNTFDMNNPERIKQIKQYAQYIAHNACLLASTMGSMVLTGSEKAPDSFGEFYKEARENKLIGKLEPERGIQPIFDHFLGKDVLVSVGLGGSDTAERLNNMQNFNVNNLNKKYSNYEVLGGILNNGRGHFMFYDNNFNLFDTGWPNDIGPRKHAWEISEWLKAPYESHKIQSALMLIKIKNAKLYK